MYGASIIEMVVGKKSVEVSGVRCQDEHRSVRKSRAGLCARRNQIIAHFRIRSAQWPTLLIRVVTDT